jgi:hypothetical protein
MRLAQLHHQRFRSLRPHRKNELTASWKDLSSQVSLSNPSGMKFLFPCNAARYGM